MPSLLEDVAPMLSEPETAELLGIRLGTLRKWRKSNRGPVHVRFARIIRYRKQDVAQFIENHLAGREDTE